MIPTLILSGISIICLLLTGYYVLLMWEYQKSWRSIPVWQIPTDFIPQTKITILISARNEEQHIGLCLESIVTQDYPLHLYEVIVIDDHSTDQTAAIVTNLKKKYPQINLIQLSKFRAAKENIAFKKWAIQQGIEQSNGTLIIGTDADCIAPPNWLNFMVSFYESKKYAFIAAPVNFYQEKNILEYFQSLDFVGMMGITGGGIQGRFQHMCNGANLAYEKDAFRAVNGFEGINGKASGDDMLLLQKMAKKFPNRIGFLKNPEATVKTYAMENWKNFMAQRVRWASKSSDYSEWKITLRLAMVFTFCWAILLSPFLVIWYGKSALGIFLGMLLVKVIVDYFFLNEMSHFFKRTDLMKKYFQSIPLHIIYIALVGLMANLSSSYEWKGRKVK